MQSNQEKLRLNAADRKSYVGEIYNLGKKAFKHNFETGEDAVLYEDDFYVHDSDAYGLTYNCLGFDIINAFPYEKFCAYDTTTKIIRIFDFLKELFAKMGNEQSGGMALVNYDTDLAYIFTKLNVDYKGNENIFSSCIHSLILWCNNMHTRMGQTSYYVTLNTGLGTDDFSRFLTFTLLDEFEKSGDLVFKPNIVFKVKKGINRFNGDRNFDLYQKALNCSSRKMIPTYLLCDCEEDKDIPAEKLSVMGCRTRVVSDVHGSTGSVGRGNIANASINLPLVALKAIYDYEDSATSEEITIRTKYLTVKTVWLCVAEKVEKILIDRWHKTLNADKELFPTNYEYKLWCEDMNKAGVAETLKHGTLSIGFIGLSEMLEIITGKKFWQDEETYKLALDFVSFMRDYTDSLTEKYGINFSLLATAGENISGAFTGSIEHKIESISSSLNGKGESINFDFLKKGFLTNSFHVDVNSGLDAIEKLKIEGPFHKYANGGSISYVEISEAPIGNAEGLTELAEVAVESGVRYLGFNFPKDVCKKCGAAGLFDECPVCKSREIIRIRRVSGYLEILDGFTSGKKAEVSARKNNM